MSALVVNGKPLEFGVLSILELGRVDPRPGFANQRYIYTIGFKSVRTYYSLKNPDQKVQYTSEIIEGDNKPMFRVTPHDDPSLAITHETPTGAWQSIIKRINDLKSMASPGKRQSTSVSGPEYFGFAKVEVMDAIRALPGADQIRLEAPPTKKKKGAGGEDKEGGAEGKSSAATADGGESQPPSKRRKSAPRSNSDYVMDSIAEESSSGAPNDSSPPKSAKPAIKKTLAVKRPAPADLALPEVPDKIEHEPLIPLSSSTSKTSPAKSNKKSRAAASASADSDRGDTIDSGDQPYVLGTGGEVSIAENMKQGESSTSGRRKGLREKRVPSKRYDFGADSAGESGLSELGGTTTDSGGDASMDQYTSSSDSFSTSQRRKPTTAARKQAKGKKEDKADGEISDNSQEGEGESGGSGSEDEGEIDETKSVQFLLQKVKSFGDGKFRGMGLQKLDKIDPTQFRALSKGQEAINNSNFPQVYESTLSQFMKTREEFATAAQQQSVAAQLSPPLPPPPPPPAVGPTAPMVPPQYSGQPFPPMPDASGTIPPQQQQQQSMQIQMPVQPTQFFSFAPDTNTNNDIVNDANASQVLGGQQPSSSLSPSSILVANPTSPLTPGDHQNQESGFEMISVPPPPPPPEMTLPSLLGGETGISPPPQPLPTAIDFAPQQPENNFGYVDTSSAPFPILGDPFASMESTELVPLDTQLFPVLPTLSIPPLPAVDQPTTTGFEPSTLSMQVQSSASFAPESFLQNPADHDFTSPEIDYDMGGESNAGGAIGGVVPTASDPSAFFLKDEDEMYLQPPDSAGSGTSNALGQQVPTPTFPVPPTSASSYSGAPQLYFDQPGATSDPVIIFDENSTGSIMNGDQQMNGVGGYLDPMQMQNQGMTGGEYGGGEMINMNDEAARQQQLAYDHMNMEFEQVRMTWELPMTVHMLSALRTAPLFVPPVHIDDLEYALVDPQTYHALLGDIHSRLLVGVPCKDEEIAPLIRDGTWVNLLREKLDSFYQSFWPCNPLEIVPYEALPSVLRVLILRALLEWRMDQSPEVTEAVSTAFESDPTALRLTPIGSDRDGTTYYYFSDFIGRLYRCREPADKSGECEHAKPGLPEQDPTLQPIPQPSKPENENFDKDKEISENMIEIEIDIFGDVVAPQPITASSPPNEPKIEIGQEEKVENLKQEVQQGVESVGQDQEQKKGEESKEIVKMEEGESESKEDESVGAQNGESTTAENVEMKQEEEKSPQKEAENANASNDQKVDVAQPAQPPKEPLAYGEWHTIAYAPQDIADFCTCLDASFPSEKKLLRVLRSNILPGVTWAWQKRERERAEKELVENEQQAQEQQEITDSHIPKKSKKGRKKRAAALNPKRNYNLEDAQGISDSSDDENENRGKFKSSRFSVHGLSDRERRKQLREKRKREGSIVGSSSEDSMEDDGMRGSDSDEWVAGHTDDEFDEDIEIDKRDPEEIEERRRMKAQLAAQRKERESKDKPVSSGPPPKGSVPFKRPQQPGAVGGGPPKPPRTTMTLPSDAQPNKPHTLRDPSALSVPKKRTLPAPTLPHALAKSEEEKSLIERRRAEEAEQARKIREQQDQLRKERAEKLAKEEAEREQKQKAELEKTKEELKRQEEERKQKKLQQEQAEREKKEKEAAEHQKVMEERKRKILEQERKDEEERRKRFMLEQQKRAQMAAQAQAQAASQPPPPSHSPPTSSPPHPSTSDFQRSLPTAPSLPPADSAREDRERRHREKEQRERERRERRERPVDSTRGDRPPPPSDRGDRGDRERERAATHHREREREREREQREHRERAGDRPRLPPSSGSGPLPPPRDENRRREDPRRDQQRRPSQTPSSSSAPQATPSGGSGQGGVLNLLNSIIKIASEYAPGTSAPPAASAVPPAPAQTGYSYIPSGSGGQGGGYPQPQAQATYTYTPSSTSQQYPSGGGQYGGARQQPPYSYGGGAPPSSRGDGGQYYGAQGGYGGPTSSSYGGQQQYGGGSGGAGYYQQPPGQPGAPPGGPQQPKRQQTLYDQRASRQGGGGGGAQQPPRRY